MSLSSVFGTAPERRLHAADHVAAGVEMAARGHRASLVAEDVAHADAGVAGREEGQTPPRASSARGAAMVAVGVTDP